jgi:hypothetical protein
VARAANATGGVTGRPVELVEVDPAQPLRPGRLEAPVGGFGIAPPPGIPWLLPADATAADADVMPAELTPAAAGATLAADLASTGINGTIGVVVGSRPESAMAQGVCDQLAKLLCAACCYIELQGGRAAPHLRCDRTCDCCAARAGRSMRRRCRSRRLVATWGSFGSAIVCIRAG